MSSGTTALGLLPMALGLGRGADLRQPLALAVIGGLVSSTALTLVVVPVAYTLWEDLRGRAHSALGRPREAGLAQEAAS
jgi:multidrug efflux pump subunit AcrB